MKKHILKLPKKVNGIKQITYTVTNGRARVARESAEEIQSVVAQLRQEKPEHKNFPLSWKVKQMMQMRPDTLANRILASEAATKVGRMLRVGGV